MKGDRSVLKCHSIHIKQLTGAIVPVGSGKKKRYLKTIYMYTEHFMSLTFVIKCVGE